MIAVIYLVWGPLGVAPLRRFMVSYRSHSAGVDHVLVLALNGLDADGAKGRGPAVSGGASEREELLAEIESIGVETVLLERPVLDLAAYVLVAQRLKHDRVCMLNSHSEPLANGWLAKLGAGLDHPSAGIVGASGSWFSNRSWVAHSLGLPSAYRGLIPDRRIAREQFIQMSSEHPSGGGEQVERDRVSAFVRNLPALPTQLIGFKPFPAWHLRTNAFMLERARLLSLRTGRLASKMDTYRLESGKRSITAQIQSRGLRALVVDREGETYEPARWDRSRTLWQADQERLLVADNQTRLYANGGIDRRKLLSVLAWGAAADPRPSGREG